jgi:hypothetical protein
VRECYQNAVEEQQPPNTVVGLFIKVEHDLREHGWAANIVHQMKTLASNIGSSALVIPLRLPTRYEVQNAEMPFEEFVALKRENGESADHWLRLHTRLGAQVIGLCTTSHQHAMNLDDLRRQMDCPPILKTGLHLVRRHNEWFRAFVNLDLQMALINQECVWVRHSV